MEPAMLLGPAGGIPPLDPFAGPGAIRERVALPRCEQQGCRPTLLLPGRDVDHLDFDRRISPDMIRNGVPDHRVKVDRSGRPGLGLAQIEAAVLLRRVPELLNDIQLTPIRIDAPGA